MRAQQLLYRSAKIGAGRTGASLNLTPRALGWDRIHFAVRHLAPGASWSGLSRDEERCLVLLRGSFDVSWKGASHRIGPRADVFSGYPHAVYLPARTPFKVVAQRRCEIADCRAPLAGTPSRRASSGPRTAASRFAAAATRRGRSSTSCRRRLPADRLLVCEVFTPGGNWSSYPPHKHDTDRPAGRSRSSKRSITTASRIRTRYGFQRRLRRPRATAR